MTFRMSTRMTPVLALAAGTMLGAASIASAHPGPGGMTGPGWAGRATCHGQGMMHPGFAAHGMGGWGPGGRNMHGHGSRGLLPGAMRINKSLELSTADVGKMFASWLAWRGAEDITVGNVTQDNGYIIAVNLVDADGDVVHRFEVNRQTGWVRPAGDG